MEEWSPWRWAWEILVPATAILCLLLVGIVSFTKRRKADNPNLITGGSPPALLNSLLPSPVRSLSAETDGRDASVTLKWIHPAVNWSEVNGYEIRYKKLSARHKSPFKLRTIPCLCETFKLTQDHGIEPLNKYLFEIRPTSGHWWLCAEWTSTVVFIKWYCRFPGCFDDRRKRRSDGSVCEFCSTDHAREFGTKYCLLPGCDNEKCKDYHFCTREHLEKATREGCSGLVPLEQSCKEYRELQKNFSKAWCKEKGRQPQIRAIFTIINPSLKQKWEEYRKSISWWHRGTAHYYHGTQLCCDLLEYLQPCSNARCGICGITKKGFDPDRISSSHWQRFGKGFYLAPNSSKSYDYTRAAQVRTMPPVATLPYRALLVCDVVPGRKYTMYKNAPDLQGPPHGYHSVYGKAKWLWFKVSQDLNYDELVVFNAAAIRPSFILLCENLID